MELPNDSLLITFTGTWHWQIEREGGGGVTCNPPVEFTQIDKNVMK